MLKYRGMLHIFLHFDHLLVSELLFPIVIYHHILCKTILSISHVTCQMNGWSRHGPKWIFYYLLKSCVQIFFMIFWLLSVCFYNFICLMCCNNFDSAIQKLLGFIRANEIIWGILQLHFMNYGHSICWKS